VLKVTSNAEVDLVFDPVSLVNNSLRCPKHKGRILVIGFAGIEGNIEKIIHESNFAEAISSDRLCNYGAKSTSYNSDFA